MAVQLVRQAVLDAAPLIVIGGDIVEQCAWCGSMRTDLGWQGAGALLHRIGRYRVSHGICPDCHDRLMAGWRGEMGD